MTLMTPTPYFNKFQLEYIERDMQGPLRTRIAELEAAITEFSKATSMKGGPSLAMQRHDPTWEAWKKLCQKLKL